MQTESQKHVPTTALQQAYAFKLSLRDAVVLEALGSLLALDDTATVSISQWELSKMCGISVQGVQRALIALRDAGLIARLQEEKKSGNVALTTVLPKAWAVIGIEVEWSQSHGVVDIPASVAQHCFKLSRPALMAICEAFEARNVHALTELTGADCGITVTIIDAIRAELVAGGESAIAKMREGERLVVSTSQGEGITIDLTLFQLRSPDHVHETFLKKVLERVVATRKIETKEQITTLLAEAAYTRARGFVSQHDAEHAVRVLAKVMGQTRWSRPHRMTDVWYQAATAAVVSTQSTGSSFCVH